MANYLANAFSLGMLSVPATGLNLTVVPVHINEVRCFSWASFVGHKDTAHLLTELLGVVVRENRMSLKLSVGDFLYVAQYKGPRLPEGTTQLPEGATFEFLRVVVLP